MFPRDITGITASVAGHVKSVVFPTNGDIKVYVNIIVSELNQAASSQAIHTDVSQFYRFSRILGAKSL